MAPQHFISLQKVRNSSACQLCPWRIVPSPMTDSYVLAVGYTHLDFPKFPVGCHIRRLVRHQVLLAQFPFELPEGLIQVLYIFGNEGATASRLTKLLQRFPVNSIHVRTTYPY